MMKVVRRLEERDVPALEAFLHNHADSSMFLRANLARAGIADNGAVYQACYAASLHGDVVTAVVAHAWNDLLLFQAPQNLAAVTWLAVAASGREVAGFSGPLDQVEAARGLLGLEDANGTVRMRIRWPDGRIQEWSGLPADRYVTLTHKGDYK